MTRQYDPEFIKALKKLEVRIRKKYKERIALFALNPYDPRLNNHLLRKPYQGLRSIDITYDYRAIYEEIKMDNETIAYFTILGTHQELYQ